MYKEFETRTSYKYLQKVIAALEEPVCILGGWAVFFHVNKNFRQAQGRPYLGSRDIDVGFHLNPDATPEGMKQSPLTKSLFVLQSKLGFEPLAFRFFKDLHTETGKEAAQGENVHAHLRFPMYVDIIVDNIPKQFKNVFGFQPIDEPLLRYAFSEEKCRTVLKEFNRRLLLPTPDVLLGTKAHSLAGRDKQHKRVKDLCDIFALLWYGGSTPQETAAKSARFIQTQQFRQTLAKLQQEDYEQAAGQLGHAPEEIERVISVLAQSLRDGLPKGTRDGLRKGLKDGL